MAVASPPPRQVYAGVGDQIARFGGTYIRQTKGRWAGKPLIHDAWQLRELNELFLKYEDGENVYDEGLLGVARKNGKSTIGSELGLFSLLASGEQGPEVYAAAGSREQARVVFGQAKDMVEKSPKLRDWLKPQKNAILCPHNGGVFRVLSADAGLQYGLNPSFVIIDELWVHKDPELYWALTTGDLARENCIVLSITTAGWDRGSLCFDRYQHGKKLLDEGGINALRAARFFFKWFEPDPKLKPNDPRAWKQANPSSWLTEEILRRRYRRFPESVFRRLHLNQWTETEDTWIKAWQWDACQGKVLFDPNLPTWVSVDVGVRRDSAGITWGQWHDDKLHVGHELIFPQEEGESFGVADIRGRVAQRAQRINALHEINFDPWQFRESAEILAERGLPMVEFNQNSSRMGPASETLYELVVDKRIVHDGDPHFKQQVLSGVVGPTDRGGWRISKRKSGKIDGLVSLAMTADRAVTMRFVRPPLVDVDDFRIQAI